ATPRNFVIAAGAYNRTLYPEYLTDPAINYCPSDPSDSPDDAYAKVPFYNPYTGQTVNIGDPIFNVLCTQQTLGVQAADMSYWYLGWVFDLVDWNDPKVQSPFNPDNYISEQLVAAATNIGLLSILVTGVPPDDIELRVNQNIDLSRDRGFGVYCESNVDGLPLGNGRQGCTIYRMREGIERFLITDINNPGASSMAQSTLFIMADGVSTSLSEFNHIPGGSNILYMDGHVAFMRYQEQGPGPINGPVAELVGGLLGADLPL
ncbi:MAG TPA: hypothetical protein ENN29_08400, partial [Candidatus Hydrogenedentes bacterium]|nr:hypothetical protein [Candidatus Hydrogenedentota bacterium]